MADSRPGKTGTDRSAPATGAGGHHSTDLQQGLHGGTERAGERGRDEFQGRGEAAELDEGRAEAAGRHYGRSGTEEPGPGSGRGPLQPEEGTVVHPENQMDLESPGMANTGGAPSRSQGDHETPFAHGRDAGQQKQVPPGEGRAPGKPDRR